MLSRTHFCKNGGMPAIMVDFSHPRFKLWLSGAAMVARASGVCRKAKLSPLVFVLSPSLYLIIMLRERKKSSATRNRSSSSMFSKALSVMHTATKRKWFCHCVNEIRSKHKNQIQPNSQNQLHDRFFILTFPNGVCRRDIVMGSL
jgi:hypothetical protein